MSLPLNRESGPSDVNVADVLRENWRVNRATDLEDYLAHLKVTSPPPTDLRVRDAETQFETVSRLVTQTP